MLSEALKPQNKVTVNWNRTLSGVEVQASIIPEYTEILTPQALAFVAKLARRFESRRRELLAARAARQAEFNAGKLPNFLPQTAHIRAGDWSVAPCPADLQDRRVEITGPTDRKMVINALNSGAKVFMADFEDSNAPTWDNMIQGQLNLRDAVRRSITFEQNGKGYRLNERTAVLMVRPRLASGREPPARRRQSGLGRDVRFRALLLSQRKRGARPRHGAVLLPAEDGVALRGAAVERHLQLRPGRTWRRARLDQGHGADRDRARRVSFPVK